MSEKVITIHKTPHVSWQGIKAEAIALGLLEGVPESHVTGTEKILVMKKKADAPTAVHTPRQSVAQPRNKAIIVCNARFTLPSVENPVPQPLTSFEDTTEAWEAGYRAGLAAQPKSGPSDLISREAAETYQREGLFAAGCTVEQVEAGLYCLRALPSQQAQGVMLPDDISAALRVIGRAKWGAVPARPDAEHVANFAKTLRITREHFSTEGPQELHGVYVAGSDVVICHTGTSPNSGVHARAIVGAWNWLLDTATAQQEGA